MVRKPSGRVFTIQGTEMLPTSLPFWLSRAAAITIPVFLFAAYRSLKINPRGQVNRLAAIFNCVFALWAFAAMFWYSATEAAVAQMWYKSFSWTWSLFPPLVLHFNILMSGINIRRHPRVSNLLLALMYLPCAFLIVVTPEFILSDPVFKLGHWMLTINPNLLYYLFVSHYFLYILAGIVIVQLARLKTKNPAERTRLAIIAWSSSLAIGLGFITDGIFIMAHIDFPNLGIFWTLFLSIGLLTAMDRFGFMSPLPLTETPRILNALADMVIFLDENAKISWANRSSLESIGLKNLEEVKGKSVDIFVGGQDAATIAETAQGRLDFFTTRTQWGSAKTPVSVRARSLVDLNQVRGAIVTAMDMRLNYALQKAEYDAADSGLLFNEFIEHSLDGIIITDADGNITIWNAPMVSLTGLSTSDVEGSKIWDTMARLAPPDKKNAQDSSGMKRSIITAMLGSPSPWTSRVIEHTIIRPDGQKRILQGNSFIIPLHNGAISATIMRDVTENRRAAEELVERIRKLDHAQKMDAVGSLTGGIAHDFNNTLGGIVGSISLIKLGVADGSYKTIADIDRELNIIDRSATRASASVARLLTLTKKRLPETHTFKLKEVIKRVSEFSMRSMDKAVSIELPKNSKDATITGDPGLIEQLLLNIFINAEHAMTVMRPRGQKRGGTIHVQIDRFRPTQSFLATNPAASKQDYWCLSIRDEGVGIPHHVLPHIFDPFYTTKTSEKSNGLGLAMVHSIAAQHGGFVDVSSELGKGTIFSIFLPIASETGLSERPKTIPKRGSGTILIVDDDDMVRDTASVMLGALGYKTESAISGEEAIDIFKAKPELWTAVIMDVRMSGISGDEAAIYLRSIRPDIPVVLASGYISDEAMFAAQNQENMTFIQKPYTIEMLSDALGLIIA